MCPKLYNVLRHSRVTRYERIQNEVNKTTKQRIGRNKLCREKKTVFKKGLFFILRETKYYIHETGTSRYEKRTFGIHKELKNYGK